MSRLTNDLRRGAHAVRARACSTCSTPRCVYATALALLLQLSPRLTLLALHPLPVAARGRRALASRHIYRASRAIQEQLGTMSTAIQEDLAGIAVIKHYTLEERAAARRFAASTTSTWPVAGAGAGARAR